MAIKILYREIELGIRPKDVLDDNGNVIDRVPEQYKPDPSIKYEVIDGETFVKISFTLDRFGEPFSGETVVRHADYAGRVVEVSVCETSVRSEVVVNPIFESCTIATQRPNRSLGKGDRKVAKIAFAEDGSSAAVLLCSPFDAITTYESIAIPANLTDTGALIAHSPAAADLLAKVRRKARMLNRIDPNHSLSYLEAQVDVLTRIVLTLAGGNPAVPTELAGLLREADAVSVIDAKPLKKIRAEFAAHKANVRDAQRDYFTQA